MERQGSLVTKHQLNEMTFSESNLFCLEKIWETHYDSRATGPILLQNISVVESLASRFKVNKESYERRLQKRKPK